MGLVRRAAAGHSPSPVPGPPSPLWELFVVYKERTMDPLGLPVVLGLGGRGIWPLSQLHSLR